MAGKAAPTAEERDFTQGILCGLGAYLWWGFMPIYIKLLSYVNVVELLGHRVFWSFVLMALLLTYQGAWRRLSVALRSNTTKLLLLGSTVVITFNWLGFLWAVYTDRLSHASLGYYINPLVSVFLGFLIFGERLRLMQKVALVLAGTAVVYLTFRLGELPWISLFLAFSFGCYGLFRKLAPVEAASGLAVETALVSPVILLAMWYLESTQGLSLFHGSIGTIVALPFAGVITAVPLVLFSAAARRLPLSAIGFLQYITPSLQLLLAVVFFGEVFTIHHAFTFAIIWLALGLYTNDMVRHRNAKRRALREALEEGATGEPVSE